MVETGVEAPINMGESTIAPMWWRHDLERALIREGSEVVSDDLERLGSVRALRFDASGHLLGVVVGLMNDTETEIPAGLIVSAADGSLYLQCTRHELCSSLTPAQHAASAALALPA